MMRRCTTAVRAALLALALLAGTATPAHADDDEKPLDARLEGYTQKVQLEGSTALMYLLLVILSIVALGVLFKDAKRSHLD